MNRRNWLGGIAVVSLLLTGCTAAVAESDNADPEATHTMPDGTEMSGAEHEAHGAGAGGTTGPSDAAEMICQGQVVSAVREILAVPDDPARSTTWEAPMFGCTYDIAGAPLSLSVHDATDVALGEEHFAELKDGFPNAEDIEGLAGLGMPAFSTGDGIVAFLRDGKTLLVDTTALPEVLGAGGNKTRHQAAYALASAVLVCWVEHD